MRKKEDFIGVRITKELKASLEQKARGKGISLSRLLQERLQDTYKSDKEQIVELISQRKQERPLFWEELEKSPILREFENIIPALYSEFINPISNKADYQPVVLLGWINMLFAPILKHFDSIPEEHKLLAAERLIAVGKSLIDGLHHIKADDKNTQAEIIRMKTDLAEQAAYHLTALAFAKESFVTIKTELEKVGDELIEELKKKPRGLKYGK